MRPASVALLALALLCAVPAAQANCHHCLEQAVDDCTGPGDGDCVGSLTHAVLHADEVAAALLERTRGCVDGTAC